MQNLPLIRTSAGCRVQNADFRVQGVGCRVQIARCRVQSAGCWVQSAECRVQSAGCRVQGAGCRVQGAGLTVVKDVREHEEQQDHREHDLVHLPDAAIVLDTLGCLVHTKMNVLDTFIWIIYT